LQVILKPARPTSSSCTSKPRSGRHRPRQHDLKFEEDNWESPTLGAWGIGWQVMLDGLEVTQFTYFQQCGGIDLDLVPAELTYGLERLTAFLQDRKSVYDIEWVEGRFYGDVRYLDELQYSVYNFEMADVKMLWTLLDLHEAEAQRLIDEFNDWAKGGTRQAPVPAAAAYDHVLNCSHTFNLLDARGAISVTERVGVIGRVRKLAVGVATAWMEQQALAECCSGGGGAMSTTLPFLFELGVEEIPHWMIEPALADLDRLFQQFLKPERLPPARSGWTARRAGWCCAPNCPSGRKTAKRSWGRRSRPGRVRPRASRGATTSPVEALAVETTPKGEYYALHRTVTGRDTRELLAEALPGHHHQAALAESDVLDRQGPAHFHPAHPLDRRAAGRAGRRVRNRRREVRRAQPRPPPHGLGRDRLRPRELRRAPGEERRHPLGGQAPQAHPGRHQEAAAGHRPEAGGRRRAARNDLVYLTEYPTPILGELRPAVPGTAEEVLVTVMRHHQKYFSVNDAEGKLAPALRRRDEHEEPTPRASSAAATSACCAPASTTRASSGNRPEEEAADACRIWPTSPSRPSSAATSKRPSA
jgi:tetrameric-type glycyl-tRNA synthetase alpha subunit